jgi:hypothetical protein
MSDSKQSDHWDILASVLGAEPEKKEPGEPAPRAEEKTPKTTEDIIIDDIIEDIIKDADIKASEAEPPSEPVATPPARPVSNWDALAMELGIEVKPEPLPPPAPVQVFAPKEVEKKAAFRAEQPREPSKQATAEFGKHIEPLGISEPPLSAKEDQEQSEKKSRHRRRRRRKGRDKDRPIDEMNPPSSASQGNAGMDEDLTLPEVSLEKSEKSGMELGEESKEDEAEKQHSKHRHSRRGSRKRGKKRPESDEERGVEAKAGAVGRAEAADSSETNQEFAGEEDNADEEYEDRGERGVKTGFRAIPTWEEAVGCIVTKNMESRPRRQGGGPPRSRSGADSHKRRRK